jgi:hypothetical protein
VFTYRCPSCGKQHTTESAFDQAFASRCLRCGAVFQVSEEVVHGAPVSAAIPAPGEPDEAITAGVPETAGTYTDADGHVSTFDVDRGTSDDIDGGIPLTESNLADLLEEGAEGEGVTNLRRLRKGRRLLRLPHGPHGDDEESDDSESESAAFPQDGPANDLMDQPIAGTDSPKWQTRQWVIVSGVAAAVLILCGMGSYFIFLRGPSKKPADKVAKTNDKSKSTGSSTPAATEKEEPGDTTDPKPDDAPRKPKNQEVLRISSARLASELTANREEANRKYENTLMEVTGVFDKIDLRESDQPPARPHAILAGLRDPILCDLLTTTTDMRRWNNLLGGVPITVRGIHGKNGCLHACELLPLSSPADAKYKNKEVELTGYVESVLPANEERQFPSIVLEKVTSSRAQIECMFRKTDEEEVLKIQPGTPITIKGTCSGRTLIEDRFLVRIDNCQLVYSSAPIAGGTRVDVVNFLREYEEDLQAGLRPPLGEEEVIKDPITVTRLGNEITADKMVIDNKYRNKIIIVSGRLRAKSTQYIQLESEDTNQVLKVKCHFTRHAFKDVPPRSDYLIQGLCSGMPDATSVHLDNCEYYDPQRSKDPHRLTADFLPHTPDRVLTYDIVVFPALSSASATIVRQAYLQREVGATDTVSTHSAKYSGKGLFEPGEDPKWVLNKKTQKFRLAGPVYKQRNFAGFVEQGENVATKSGDMEVVWQPVLKLNARLGDTWKWSHANANHLYSVEKFANDPKDRISVVIKETVTFDLDRDHPIEIRHVYVRNVGETERSETQHITAKEKRTLAEKKLIEDADESYIKDVKSGKPISSKLETPPSKDGKTRSPR